MHTRPSNRLGLWALGLLCALPCSASADSMRCGTKLVNEQELAIQVREKCGDPVSEELIGYTLRGRAYGAYGDREYKIEQWIYGPDKGYYYVLVFEAGRLRTIDHVKQ